MRIKAECSDLVELARLALGGPLVARLVAGGIVLLERDRFYAETSAGERVTVHRPAPLTLRVELGVGVAL